MHRLIAADPQPTRYLELACEVASVALTASPLPPTEVPSLLKNLCEQMLALDNEVKAKLAENAGEILREVVKSAELATRDPAVPIAESIKQDFLICLEDGKPTKFLKSYLDRKFNLTPEQYRKRWGLDADYPMTPPGLSGKRAEEARKRFRRQSA